MRDSKIRVVDAPVIEEERVLTFADLNTGDFFRWKDLGDRLLQKKTGEDSYVDLEDDFVESDTGQHHMQVDKYDVTITVREVK
jgi:hypothetical protein